MNFDPVTLALGNLMAEFHDSYIPRTRSAEFWKQRDTSTAILLAPSDLHGDAVAQIVKWRQKDHTPNGQPLVRQGSTLPVVLFSIARDFSLLSGYGKPVLHRIPVKLPNDPEPRVIDLSIMRVGIPAQVAVVADDPTTARSMAAAFAMYLDRLPKNQFMADFKFPEYDQSIALPITYERNDPMPVNMPASERYLSILVIDLVVQAVIPELNGVVAGESGQYAGESPLINEVDYHNQTTEYHVVLPEDQP